MKIKISLLFLALELSAKNTIDNLSDRKKNVKEQERGPFKKELPNTD